MGPAGLVVAILAANQDIRTLDGLNETVQQGGGREDGDAGGGRLTVQARRDGAGLVDGGGDAVHLPVSGDQRPGSGARKGHGRLLGVTVAWEVKSTPLAPSPTALLYPLLLVRARVRVADLIGRFFERMLAGFRSFAKSPFAILLFGLLIISFAIFGISDVFKGPQGSGVITAGSRELLDEAMAIMSA